MGNISLEPCNHINKLAHLRLFVYLICNSLGKYFPKFITKDKLISIYTYSNTFLDDTGIFFSYFAGIHLDIDPVWHCVS